MVKLGASWGEWEYDRTYGEHVSFTRNIPLHSVSYGSVDASKTSGFAVSVKETTSQVTSTNYYSEACVSRFRSFLNGNPNKQNSTDSACEA